MTVEALTLPAYLEGVEAGAGFEYGRRQLSWTLSHPGKLFGCSFEFAWITVSERELWRGEPLWVSALRRGDGGRHPFTSLATQKLSAELLPVIARIGFGRMWEEAHRGRLSVDWIDAQQREAAAEAKWWADRVEVNQLYADGLLVFEPCAQRVSYVAAHSHDRTTSVLARALLDGEEVGWMTTSGELIPLGDGLDRARGWA